MQITSCCGKAVTYYSVAFPRVSRVNNRGKLPLLIAERGRSVTLINSGVDSRKEGSGGLYCVSG